MNDNQKPVRFTNGQINNFGKILADDMENLDALRDINLWRNSHIIPMDNFADQLRKMAKKYGKDVIVAERMKRLPTIIDKLSRFDTMKLSQMQDVAGIRIVLKNVDDTEKFYRELIKKEKTCKLRRTHNYIEEPKRDGYRSIHLIYEYANKKKPEYDGLFVEVQIRSSLEHLWATAIESMGVYLGESFKTGKGNHKWRDLFSLVSSAFAYFEKRQPAKEHADLGLNRVYEQLYRANKSLNALEKISSFSAASQDILGKDKHSADHFTIISLDLDKHKVDTFSYDKDDYDEAMAEYEKLEKRGDRYDQVLVSVNKLVTLDDAYPNYFLDLKQFAETVSDMLDEYRTTSV